MSQRSFAEKSETDPPSVEPPARLGYRMPAEWEPHAATWLTWPRPDGISFPGRYEEILPVYLEFIRLLQEGEPVHINVWDPAMEEAARARLTQARVPLQRIAFHHFPAYEPWCRDHGPIFLVRETDGQRQRAVVDWDYNAWGNKYPPFDLDDAVPRHVAACLGLPLFSPKMVLEGGSIDVNGAGWLLTTESCLLNPNRNPRLSKAEIEAALRDYLGVRHILWLHEGIAGDDTDGHIDDLARFVDPHTVVAVVEPDPTDPNHLVLRENLQRLRAWRKQTAAGFRIVEIPSAGRVEFDGQALPASYANFYIANHTVIVPTFNRPQDAVAVDLLQQCFPHRRVAGLDASALVWGLGAFHCLSQQEPEE